jgi:primosomal protein N' (replication factor Y)
VSLTFHSQKQELCCHYCNYQQEVFHRCPAAAAAISAFSDREPRKLKKRSPLYFPGWRS